ncbi:MAG: M23 family metallopeptidase [Anaerolineaceae bacterium]|nr:M23 family metallopeptidase [Anaerolineaceae bacterium]
MRWQKRLVFLLMITLLAPFSITTAQDNAKPFRLPMDTAAGPSTWLFGQAYGNTTGAYNFGTAWYSAGQGLHFGIDVSMPCGTPLVAVADGDVIYVDNLSFGAGPHNLILRHPQAGLTTLYGHLLDRPPLQQFQPVKAGQVVGYSGDPDVTCDSRPHLHFEVRSLDYRTAYNPLDYIDAPWDVLAGIGPFGYPLFQQDLTNSRRWIYLDDQPPVAFGGVRLNNYAASLPDDRPPANPPLFRASVDLPADASWEMTPFGYDGCCLTFWWHPTDSNRLYTLDGSPGVLAGITEWDMSAHLMGAFLGEGTPPIWSPDGTYQVNRTNNQVSITRLADAATWFVDTGGELPAISADNSRLLWLAQNGAFIPGGTPPPVTIWVSAINGQNRAAIASSAPNTRLSARWLDGSRLLLSTVQRTVTTLSVYNTADGTTYDLGSWDRVRGVSVAPGGGRLLFYRSFQPDPLTDGVYTIQTTPGAVAEKLPWFGGWRWRDADSVYYIPFTPTESHQTLAYYHIPSGENRALTNPTTQPFTIAQGIWSVSPDGQQIVFLNAADHRLWVVAASTPG